MKTTRQAKIQTRKRGNKGKAPEISLRIEPRTPRQARVFQEWDRGQNLVLTGSAGTGKSFLSLFLMIREAVAQDKRILVVRTAVPSRDMGHMPGTLQEKMSLYELPYQSIVKELMGRGDAYDLVKKSGLVEFTTTSYLRGITLEDTLVLFDEIQNATYRELDTVMTRIGEGSRIVFCGDVRQTDLVKGEKSGLAEFVEILHRMDEFTSVEFDHSDIQRSGLVKNYIIARDTHGLPTRLFPQDRDHRQDRARKRESLLDAVG